MAPSAGSSADSSNSSSETSKPVRDLQQITTSTLSLLHTFAKVLESPRDSAQAIPEDAPDPLDVLHTSATLLKAHTTKLSLLIINKPFTPSAIRKVITDVSSTCVPAMMSAVEICRPSKCGQILHDEVSTCVGRVVRELEHVMQELLNTLESLNDAKVDSDSTARDSLTSTGVLWETCDHLIELKSLGLPGLVVRKARLYKSMLEDAMEELQDWAKDSEEEEDEEEDDGFGSDDVNSVEELFGSANKIPRDRTDLKETLDVSLRKLKLIKGLYIRVIRHRLETLHSVSKTQLDIDRTDGLMELLRRIPEQADELAGSLYEFDNEEAQRLTSVVCSSGKEAVELVKASWSGSEDDFSAWAGIWLGLIDKA